MDFGDLNNIKKRCRDKNRDFREVAEATCISVEQLRQIDEGIVRPRGETAILLSNILECDTNKIFIEEELLTKSINSVIELIQQFGYFAIDQAPILDRDSTYNNKNNETYKKENIVEFINYFINKLYPEDFQVNYVRMLRIGYLREDDKFNFFKRLMFMEMIKKNYKLTDTEDDIISLPISLIVDNTLNSIWIDIHKGEFTLDGKTCVVMNRIHNSGDAENYTRLVHDELVKLGLISECIDEVRYLKRYSCDSIEYKEYKVQGDCFDIDSIEKIYDILKQPYFN